MPRRWRSGPEWRVVGAGDPKPRVALRAGFRVRAFPRTLVQGGSAGRWKRCKTTTRTLTGGLQRDFSLQNNYLAACKTLGIRPQPLCRPQRALFLERAAQFDSPRTPSRRAASIHSADPTRCIVSHFCVRVRAIAKRCWFAALWTVMRMVLRCDCVQH